MRLLHRLIGLTLLFLVALGTGWICYHAAVSQAEWQRFLAGFETERLTMVCPASIAVMLLCVLYVLTGLRYREGDKYLSFQNDGGTVSVSLRGMANFISKLAAEFDDVKSLTTRIIPGPGSIDVVLNARIKDGVQIHEVCEQLQQRVRGALKESLGVTEVRTVKVNVKEIIPGRRVTWPKEE